MSKKARRTMLKYGITGEVCLLIAFLYCVFRDFPAQSLLGKYRTLCDAFTVPGILAICGGLLVWVANDGFFYGLGYCLDVTWKALIPGGRQKMLRYHKYVEQHRKKKITGYGFLYVCGGVCLAVAAVFMVLFYRRYR